jgi:uncharacterized membrane protein
MMGYGRGYGGGYSSMMGGFGGLLVFLFGALVLAGGILLIVWAVRASSGHGAAGGVSQPPSVASHDEAVAIAKRRLASGEIDKAQYDELMRSLGS